MTFIPCQTGLPLSVFSPNTALRRVLVVEDQQLIRDCLGNALEVEGNLSVRTVSSERHALRSILSGAPFDAVVLNSELAGIDMLDLVRWVRQSHQETGILVHGLPVEQGELALSCVEAGAGAFVLRDSTLEELRISLQGLLRGETHCHPRLVHSVFSHLSRSANARKKKEIAAAVLSFRELEVLRLIATGLRNKEICKELFISLHTVKNHVHRILSKLEVRGRHQAVSRARQAGWI